MDVAYLYVNERVVLYPIIGVRDTQEREGFQQWSKNVKDMQIYVGLRAERYKGWLDSPQKLGL